MKELSMFYLGGVKTIFGEDSSLKIIDEVQSFKVNKIFIICDQAIVSLGIINHVLDELNNKKIEYEIFSEFSPNPKSLEVREGVSHLKNNEYELVLVVGGGSAMDFAKAISVMATHEGDILEYGRRHLNKRLFDHKGLPLICVPTTSGTGSEINTFSVITDESENKKITLESHYLVPEIAILDPVLTYTCPQHVIAASGMDALSHAIEAYISPKATLNVNPVIDAMALESIKIIMKNLVPAYLQPLNKKVKNNMLWGSYLASTPVCAVGAGGGHGLGNSITQYLHFSHGESIGLVLPYVLEKSLYVYPERFAEMAKAIGIDVINNDAIKASQLFCEKLLEISRILNFRKITDHTDKTKEEILEFLAKEAEINSGSKGNSRPLDYHLCYEIYEKVYNDSDIEVKE